jgi:hypothetical protein
MGNPESSSAKQAVTDKIKAMTWFLVVAEMHEPTARKPPAMSRLPM